MGIAVAPEKIGIGYSVTPFHAQRPGQVKEQKTIERSDLVQQVTDQATFLSLLASGFRHRIPLKSSGALLHTRVAWILNEAAEREREIQRDEHLGEFSLLDQSRQYAFASKNSLGILHIIVTPVPSSKERSLGFYKIAVAVRNRNSSISTFACIVDLLEEVKLRQNLTKTYPVI